MVASPIRRRRAIRTYQDLAGGAHARRHHPAALMEALLDALNNNLCAAQRALSRGGQRAAPLAKASMIVASLHQVLDTRHARARQLAGVYRYLMARINRVNRANGEEILSELIGLVGTIRSAWAASASAPSARAKDAPAPVHLAQGELPGQLVALHELDRRHPRALGLLEVVDEQVVAYTHGRKGIAHPVGARNFSV
jgi:flagellin-specific chaperone FliS